MTLQSIAHLPPLEEPLADDVCCKCGKPIKISAKTLAVGRMYPAFKEIFARGTTACHECIEKYEIEKRAYESRALWDRCIPAYYRNTDTKHEGYPRNVHNEIRRYNMTDNLFVVGDDSTGRTRLLVEWMKNCIWKNDWTFNMMDCVDIGEWIDKRIQYGMVTEMAGYGILIIANIEEVVGNSKRSEWLSSVLSKRAKFQRPTLITSELSTRQFKMTGSEYTERDRKKIANLIDNNYKVVLVNQHIAGASSY